LFPPIFETVAALALPPEITSVGILANVLFVVNVIVTISQIFAYAVLVLLLEYTVVVPVSVGRILSIVYVIDLMVSVLFTLSIERYLTYLVTAVPAAPVTLALVPVVTGVQVFVVSIQYKVLNTPTPASVGDRVVTIS